MNQFMAKLSELEWSKVLVVSILAVGLYYVGLRDSGSTIEANINALREDLKIKEGKLRATQSAAEDASRFEEESKSILAQRDELIEFLPADMSVNELTQIVNREARSAGLEVTKTTDLKSSERIDFYETAKMDLQLTGTYSQIVLFLSYLTKVPRLVTFDKVSLDVSPKSTLDTARLDFKGTLVGYRYMKEKLDDGKPPLQGTGGSK